MKKPICFFMSLVLATSMVPSIAFADYTPAKGLGIETSDQNSFTLVKTNVDGNTVTYNAYGENIYDDENVLDEDAINRVEVRMEDSDGVLLQESILTGIEGGFIFQDDDIQINSDQGYCFHKRYYNGMLQKDIYQEGALALTYSEDETDLLPAVSGDYFYQKTIGYTAGKISSVIFDRTELNIRTLEIYTGKDMEVEDDVVSNYEVKSTAVYEDTTLVSTKREVPASEEEEQDNEDNSDESEDNSSDDSDSTSDGNKQDNKSNTNTNNNSNNKNNNTNKSNTNNNSSKKVVKKNNPIKVSTKTVKLNSKNKVQKISKNKAFKISKAKGKVTFSKVTKGSSKKLSITKSGVIKVSKNAKGTLKIKVKVKAAGDKNYKSKTVTKTIKVVIKKSKK